MLLLELPFVEIYPDAGIFFFGFLGNNSESQLFVAAMGEVGECSLEGCWEG